jgi:hypothetical protein
VITSGFFGSRCATGGSLPLLTWSARLGASVKFAGSAAVAWPLVAGVPLGVAFAAVLGDALAAAALVGEADWLARVAAWLAVVTEVDALLAVLLALLVVVCALLVGVGLLPPQAARSAPRPATLPTAA